MRARHAWLAAAMLLAGCGFHPLYGPRAGGAPGVQSNLALIQVALIPDRDGQLLRQALQQHFDRGDGSRKLYEISANYDLAIDQFGFQLDSSVTRYRLRVTSAWTLKSLDTGRVLTSGTARSLDGADVIDQQYFAADIANETAQRRLAELAADQITQQVAQYFDRGGPG